MEKNVACRHRSERFGSVVWTSTQNWVRLYTCRLCSSISCSAKCNLLYNEPATPAPQELRTQLNVLMWLWEGIYLSIAERCWKALKKIWQMQSKSISTFSANAFNAKNADILPFSIRWIHYCILLLKDNVSDTSKSVLPFTCLELFSWFKHIKNHLRKFDNQLAVDESFSKAMILFFKLTHRFHCTLSSIFPHEPMKQTSTVFCSALISPHLTNA